MTSRLGGGLLERQADLSALYLPSAIRTFLNNPIDAFDAVHPEFFKSFASLINVLLPSAAGYRFIREHPEETTELRAKTLSLILDWSDRKETVSYVSNLPLIDFRADDPTQSSLKVSHSVWTGVTRNLVQLFGNLTMADCAARDDGPQASLEPLHLSAEDRNRFKTHMRLLEGILNGCDRGAKVYFEASLGDISVVVYPGAHKSLRGSVYIDVCTEGGQYIPWWACQAKRLDRPNPEKLTPCEKGRRDELKACSKVGPTSLPLARIWLNQLTCLISAVVSICPLLLRKSVLRSHSCPIESPLPHRHRI